MRNIQLYLQTTPSQIDHAITAMQLLKDIQKEEPRVKLDIAFFPSFDQFTQEMLLKPEDEIKAFFEGTYKPGFSEAKEEEGKDTKNPIKYIDHKGFIELVTEGGYVPKPKFFIHVPRKKKYHQMPAQRIVFGIYDEFERIYGDYDVDIFDEAMFRSCVFCTCARIHSPMNRDNKENMIVHSGHRSIGSELQSCHRVFSELPHFGGFEFDNDDSLKINILLNLLALKVLYKRYVSICQDKVYYRNLYIGDITKTRYTLEDLQDIDSLKAKKEDPTYLDGVYKRVFNNAILLAGLTYCEFSKDTEDEENKILPLITNLYSSAEQASASELKKIYDQAEKEREERQYHFYIEAHHALIKKLVEHIKDEEEQEYDRFQALGMTYDPDQGFIEYIRHRYLMVIDYARGFNCSAEAWNYILMCYSGYLISTRQYYSAIPLMKPWVKMATKHLDLNSNPQYYCYRAGYCLALGLNKLDQFAKYARKYILCCLKDKERDSWTVCTNAAVSLAEYYKRKEEYKKAMDTIKMAKDFFENYEGLTEEDAPLRLANLEATYADILYLNGQAKEALSKYLHVMEIFFRYRDEDSWELSTVYNGLGTCYSKLGNYEKGVTYQIKCAEIMKKLKGEYHKALYIVYTNIHDSYLNLHKYVEAEYYNQLAQEIKNIYNFENIFDYSSEY